MVNYNHLQTICTQIPPNHSNFKDPLWDLQKQYTLEHHLEL